MKISLKTVTTGFLVLVAAAIIFFKYKDYIQNPWTRNGQVQADIIQVTSRVSGPIVSLPIKDNQFVKAGDVLFVIDPRTFQANYEQAQANLDRTSDSYEAGLRQIQAAKAQVEAAKAAVLQADSRVRQLNSVIEKNKAEYERQQELLPQQATSQKAVESTKANYEVAVEQHQGAVAALAQSKATLSQAEAALYEAKAKVGKLGDANASIRAARAALRQAELNLEFTTVEAPVDGYVTNLNLRLGSNAVANQPALALIDVNSYWVQGFFRETLIANIQQGDEAMVTLMTYPDQTLKGTVDSLGWGISQQDGSTGYDLLPNISPTFEWIRLAQRVPVRIHLDEAPENVRLRVGTTASVLVRTRPDKSAERGQ
ncbi:HlyD family secretion protein [Desulfopila sp. IMCC35008]|uniref:HlyD family secretion protein n=1 Tax=Desulfopila sp. IMCC35008 TaxID=2653858 RepID=UPI0013D80199|nr:HlyD family secretion protein [Desulfopila sp. IMCC35008]